MGVISQTKFCGLILLLLAVESTHARESVEQLFRFPGTNINLQLVGSENLAYQVLKGNEILQTVQLNNFQAKANFQRKARDAFILQDCKSSIEYKLVYSSDDMTHLRVSQSNVDGNSQPRDCFDLGVGHLNWYAGKEAAYQYWPIEKQKYNNYSYVTKAENNAAVSERYWLNSEGFFIYVEETTPLFIDQNSNGYENQFCLSAHSALPYNRRAERVEFTYHIGFGKDPRSTHMYVVQNLFGKPTGYPDERMVQHPIWSTWAIYKKKIDDKVVREFANKILEHGFNNSQICIDDEWEPCYGALTFSKEKFPDMKKLTDDLKKQGFRVTLWVHPFINRNCLNIYLEAKIHEFLVLNYDGDADTSWWNSAAKGAAHLDFTKAEVRAWFTERLRSLQEESGIDGFKFDAGETSWIPDDPVLQCAPELSPHQIVKDYVRTASAFGPLSEIRTGQGTQDLPVFVRMIDKDSVWGWNNGLVTLITTLLQMNLNGYPFVLPDMIGGNGYGGEPDKELLIRWIQANVFMPTLQISYAPWNYDDETIALFKKFTALHSEYTPNIMKRFKLAVETGEPVNLPIWWLDPKDTTALGIYDEYLLGDEVLCAPIVKPTSKERDIYLPKGVWTDGNTGEKIIGPIWLMAYSAPLETLPYFLRSSET